MVYKGDVIPDLKANGFVIASIHPNISCPTNKLILFTE